MSKAFTPEDGGAPEAPLLTRRRGDGPLRPITRAGHARLLSERAALEQERGKLIAQGTALGPSLRRAEVERRLGTLGILLDEVTVTDPPASRATVAFDTRVTLQDPEGATVHYRLVGVDEADARQERLSIDAPLARVLLGRSVGESVTLERPRGNIDYDVVGIDLP